LPEELKALNWLIGTILLNIHFYLSILTLIAIIPSYTFILRYSTFHKNLKVLILFLGIISVIYSSLQLANGINVFSENFSVELGFILDGIATTFSMCYVFITIPLYIERASAFNNVENYETSPFKRRYILMGLSCFVVAGSFVDYKISTLLWVIITTISGIRFMILYIKNQKSGKVDQNSIGHVKKRFQVQENKNSIRIFSTLALNLSASSIFTFFVFLGMQLDILNTPLFSILLIISIIFFSFTFPLSLIFMHEPLRKRLKKTLLAHFKIRLSEFQTPVKPIESARRETEQYFRQLKSNWN
uniref:Acyltransferase n=1 Tax=Rhabditophanes sp. KR3021 TaxID=114890 RepID=A0AC35UAM5_9BILA